jgi:acyl phosphate:glycerol-3-phosphate acyltransferase
VTPLTWGIVIIAAYLLGAVPFAFLIAGLYGKDLRQIGSGNIGATNLARACGRKWGYICFGLDVLKGLIPMAVVSQLADHRSSTEIALWLVVGLAAILGHVFPIYLKFKGGKGVSTSLGVALGMWPYLTLCGVIALLVWVGVVLKWRYVSLASICGAVAFPVALIAGIFMTPGWNSSALWPLLVAAALIPLMVIVRHRENIHRLLAGTESKIRSKSDGRGGDQAQEAK